MKLKLLILVITVLPVINHAKNLTTNYSQQLVTKCAPNSFTGYQSTDPNEIQRVRLQFLSDDGFIRPLLLGFTPNNAASDDFDYGYDASNPDLYPNDMFWNIQGSNYVIQGVGAFDNSNVYPLNVNITNAGLIKIALTGLENFESDIDVFVYDSLLGSYTQINSNDFEMVIESGIYQNRFFITFSPNPTLSLTDNDKPSTVQVSYLTRSREVYLKSVEVKNIEKIYLLNIVGKSISTWDRQSFSDDSDEMRIPVKNIPEGTYIIRVVSRNSIINKKVIIK